MGWAKVSVVLAVWVSCMMVLSGGCDDMSSRRPVSPACNVVELECLP